MDDLDDLLFGKNVKGNETEPKKRVMFKDFENSDPPGELNFSDDEDFQESLKETPTAVIKDSKIADLFGINYDDENSTPIKIKDSEPKETEEITPKSPVLPAKNHVDTVDKPKAQAQEIAPKEPVIPTYIRTPANDPVASKPENPAPISAPKMKSIFDDDDDVISNLPAKPKAPAAPSQAKKSSLMEDLFGTRPKSSPLLDTRRKKDTFNFDVPATRPSPGESLTGLGTESTSKTSSATGLSLGGQREIQPRRGRRASTVQNDPLGLLSASSWQIDDPPKAEEKKAQTPAAEVAFKSPVIEDLPEWLGGPKVPKEPRQETEKITQSEILSSMKSAETLSKTSSALTDPSIITTSVTAPIISSMAGIGNVDQNLVTKMLGMEFDQQAAMINMQQQEHELRTAAAMSQQGDKLNYLLEMQKVKLSEQEKQFNMLISRQIERQSVIEAQMKAQQDRIDAYIQTLTAQPTAISSLPFARTKEMKMDSLEHEESKVESESLIQKVQLEKLYLENTLDSLREKHEKEISILEDSYKKQIQFLEEAMVHMEKRMQDDIECLETDYKVKIEKLKEELAEKERAHKEEKEGLKEENDKLVHEIRERHYRSLEILQKEHIETIERITKSKESERQAIEIMRVDGINVENVLNKSQVIVENLEELQKRFETRDNSFIETQNSHFIVQEKNIEYLKELLEKQKDAFVDEKQKLLLTVQKLESDTTELIKEFHKQNACFKESGEILKSKEQALLRDREIFVEQTKWERERLQSMRDAWTKEEDRQLEWLAQERQALASERGKLQIFNRVKIGVDESAKIELEATIRAAQEAAASANQERLKWQDKLNELEIQKNAIKEKENHLILKAKELQEFTQSAVAKREEGLQALKQAHFIEERYKEKFNQLQKQQELLTERESKIAAEKIELARKSLSLHIHELSEMPEKDVFSNIESRLNLEGRSKVSEVPSSTQYTTDFKDIVDPHLVLLKWDLDNKLEGAKDFAFSTS